MHSESYATESQGSFSVSRKWLTMTCEFKVNFPPIPVHCPLPYRYDIGGNCIVEGEKKNGGLDSQ